MRWDRWREIIGGAVLVLAISACASKPVPAPQPPKPPDDAEQLVSGLTGAFSLNPEQQDRIRPFAREFVDRNRAILETWRQGEKIRPEVLVASRAKFDMEFTSVLTPEQRRKYEREWRRLMVKGQLFEPPSR